jgi:hypothetical protein
LHHLIVAAELCPKYFEIARRAAVAHFRSLRE